MQLQLAAMAVFPAIAGPAHAQTAVGSRRLRLSWQVSLWAVVNAACLVQSCMAQSSLLDSEKGLQPHSVTVDRTVYQGRKAVRVRSMPNADATYDAQKSGTGGGIVVLEGSSFHDGTIEVDV